MADVRWISMALALLAGCGPQAADGIGSTTTGEQGETTGVGTTGLESSGAAGSTSTTESTTDVDDTASESASSDTGPPYDCESGTFTGTLEIGFEDVVVVACDGPGWRYAGDVGAACRSGLWLRFEGERCGPVEGPFGPEYTFEGELVQGPCMAACGEEPSPESCTTFEQLCPYFACDPSTQDCPRGEHCVPTSSQGAPPWTETSSVPVVEPTQAIGSPCAPAGSWQSDCAADGFCAPVPEAGGECAAVCSTDADDCFGAATCQPCAFAAFPLGVCATQAIDC